MSSNVGLSTPRGSGTSGYVQRNLSVLKPRAVGAGAPYAPHDSSLSQRGPPRQRKPDQDILQHDRLREIEIKVLDLRDRLEDEGKLDDDDIDAKCDALRAELVRDAERGGKARAGGAAAARTGRDGIKRYQVHELAEAKIKESDRLRRALGLKDDEIGGGDGGQADDQEHPMARQERKKRERELERAKMELEQEDELEEQRQQQQHSRRQESP